MALEKHAAGFASLWRHEEVLARSMLRTLHELQRLQRRCAQVSRSLLLRYWT